MKNAMNKKNTNYMKKNRAVAWRRLTLGDEGRRRGRQRATAWVAEGDGDRGGPGAEGDGDVRATARGRTRGEESDARWR